jgi:hypothetical protein
MQDFNWVFWVFIDVFVAWFAYHRAISHNTDHCQSYDGLDNDIGCEGPDLADL